MKCGKCKQTGVSVIHVRDCYGVASAGDAAASRITDGYVQRSNKGTPERSAPTTTRERSSGPVSPEVQAAFDDQQRLKEAPRYYGKNRPLPFPAGRYAIDRHGSLKFYQIDSPTEGKWAGYVFVKLQASDDLYAVRGPQTVEIIDTIAHDPKEAMLRYGREIGSCGHCGRTLTNEESRFLGIGPVCRGKMGW